MSADIPPVVSHRNHLTCLEDVVDFELAFLRHRYSQQSLMWSDQHFAVVREFAMGLGVRLLKNIQMELGSAAGRGVEQAITLICDPGYFEKKQIRRKRTAQQGAIKAAEERKARALKQITGPSDEEIRAKRRRLEYDIQSWSDMLARRKAELTELNAKHPAELSRSIRGPVQ